MYEAVQGHALPPLQGWGCGLLATNRCRSCAAWFILAQACAHLLRLNPEALKQQVEQEARNSLSHKGMLVGPPRANRRTDGPDGPNCTPQKQLSKVWKQMLRHGARLPGLLQPAGWLASGQSTGLLQQCQACASGNLGTGSSLGEVASCSYSTDGPRSVRGAQQQRQRPRDGNKQSSASIKQASAGRDDGAGEGSRAITPAAAEVRGELASRGDAPLRTRNMVVQADVDLAMENAPAQVLELIGDPRSGVADDVTRNSFGSVTVDMVHHQASNEVYWYKYEFAGEASREAHRDARLSEYSKNLMYLLRAKDPKQ